jgi:hypothetical protein
LGRGALSCVKQLSPPVHNKKQDVPADLTAEKTSKRRKK